MDDDSQATDGYDKLSELIIKLGNHGKTCVHFDTHHSSRWPLLNDLECGRVVRCGGDIGFTCNDETIAKSLEAWLSVSKDNGIPYCVEDFDSVIFADMLGGIAETHYLDKCVVSAFVGTAEESAEHDDDVMDAIESPVDSRDPDPDILELVNKENDLLDQLPLPGNPTGEQQRKAKWLALPRRARLAVRRLHRHFFTSSKKCTCTVTT